MDNKKSFGLAVNKEVIAQISAMAALEVEGVNGTTSRPIELKKILKGNISSKSFNVSVDNGAIIIDAYISVKEDAKVKKVAEDVQKNIKEKVQTMTNNAVAQVNVFISDIVEEQPEEPDEEIVLDENNLNEE